MNLKVDLPRRKTNYRVQLASSAAQSQISCTLGPRKQAERNWFHISCSVHATNFLPYLLPWFLFKSDIFYRLICDWIGAQQTLWWCCLQLKAKLIVGLTWLDFFNEIVPSPIRQLLWFFYHLPSTLAIWDILRYFCCRRNLTEGCSTRMTQWDVINFAKLVAHICCRKGRRVIKIFNESHLDWFCPQCSVQLIVIGIIIVTGFYRTKTKREFSLMKRTLYFDYDTSSGLSRNHLFLNLLSMSCSCKK